MGLFILDSPAPSKDLDTWAQGNTCWKTEWEREKWWCFTFSSDIGIKIIFGLHFAQSECLLRGLNYMSLSQ